MLINYFILKYSTHDDYIFQELIKKNSVNTNFKIIAI